MRSGIQAEFGNGALGLSAAQLAELKFHASVLSSNNREDITRLAQSAPSPELAACALVRLSTLGMVDATTVSLVTAFLSSNETPRQLAAQLLLTQHPALAEWISPNFIRDGATPPPVLASALALYGSVTIPTLVDLYSRSRSAAGRAAISASILRAGEIGGDERGLFLPQVSPTLHPDPTPMADALRSMSFLQSPSGLVRELGIRAACQLSEGDRSAVVYSKPELLEEISRSSQSSEVRELARWLLITYGVHFPQASDRDGRPVSRAWVSDSIPQIASDYGARFDISPELGDRVQNVQPHQIKPLIGLALRSGNTTMNQLCLRFRDLSLLSDSAATVVTYLAAQLNPPASTILTAALSHRNEQVRNTAERAYCQRPLSSEALENVFRDLRARTSSAAPVANAVISAVNIAKHYNAQKRGDLRVVLEHAARELLSRVSTKEQLDVVTSLLADAGHSKRNIGIMLAQATDWVVAHNHQKQLDAFRGQLTVLISGIQSLGKDAKDSYDLLLRINQERPEIKTLIEDTLRTINPARARFGRLAELLVSLKRDLLSVLSGRLLVPVSNMDPLIVDDKRESSKIPQVSDAEALTFARSNLSYADVPNHSITEPSTRAVAYAKSFILAQRANPGLMGQFDAQRQSAEKTVKAVLTRVGIDPSRYASSRSWYTWDVAKQLYYLQHPEESTPQYLLADPCFDAIKREEIENRHIGWEVASAIHADAGIGPMLTEIIGEAPARIISSIVGAVPAGKSQPSSDQLARIGAIVRRASQNSAR